MPHPGDRDAAVPQGEATVLLDYADTMHSAVQALKRGDLAVADTLCEDLRCQIPPRAERPAATARISVATVDAKVEPAGRGPRLRLVIDRRGEVESVAVAVSPRRRHSDEPTEVVPRISAK